MTLIKQNLGAHWVIGMKGKVEDIEQFHNRIYNWGGTNGSIQWMSESFGYFWITMEKLERVMFKYMLNGMSDKLGKKRQIDCTVNRRCRCAPRYHWLCKCVASPNVVRK